MKYRYRNESEMKDSGVEWIGKIPNDWRLGKFKYFYSFGMGETILTENLEAEGIPVYSATEDNIVLGYYNNAKLLLNRGDIIIPARGNSIGSVKYVNKKCTSTQTTIYARNKFLVNSKFVYYFMIGNRKNLFYYDKTAIPQITTNQVRENKLFYPNEIEQEKIANFLDEKTSQFDLIISKKEELIKKLEEAKKSLISEVVTGKVKVVKTDDGYELVKISSEEMKDSGVEWLGEIPKDWEVKRLRFLGKLQNGISKSSDQFGYGYPFVSYSNVHKNIELPQCVEGLVNSTDEERKIYSVKENDVFFTRTSETVEEIGFASTCMETIKDATFAGFLIRFRPNDKRLHKGFSKYYFRCDLNRKYFVKEMNLVTRASLSQNLLNNLCVTLPKYDEQIYIYNALELKVGGINSSIDKLKYQIEKLKEAKQSLISEAVIGKIEILD